MGNLVWRSRTDDVGCDTNEAQIVVVVDTSNSIPGETPSSKLTSWFPGLVSYLNSQQTCQREWSCKPHTDSTNSTCLLVQYPSAGLWDNYVLVLVKKYCSLCLNVVWTGWRNCVLVECKGRVAATLCRQTLVTGVVANWVLRHLLLPLLTRLLPQ